MGINDYGGTGDALNSPPLGGPGGWAEAVAAVVDGDDTTVDARIAAAVAGIDLDPYLLPAEVLAGANVTVDRDTTPGSVIIASTATGGGGDGTDLGANFVNVKDQGAVGDGSTDDTAAINAAITAAGTGGTVYFPRTTGAYMISSPLSPLERQIWQGNHSPLYDWDETPTVNCALRATAGFSGTALVYMSNTTIGRGATFRNLMFLGNADDETGTLNGMDLGPASGGERAWRIEECQFMLFGGAAIAGHLWVMDFHNNHISRCGYGIRPVSGAAGDACTAFDNRWFGNQIYFTFHHGIELGSASAEVGAVTMIGNRIERAGTEVSGATMDPNANRDPNASGIKINRGTTIQLIGNYTDANALHGLHLEATSHGNVNNVTGVANVWKRDGTGDNATTQLSGVYVRDTAYVQLRDIITYGDPDDGGAGRIAPQYGVDSFDNDWFTWDGSIQLESNALIQSNGVRWTGTNWMCSVSDARQPVLGVPYGDAAPSNPGVGSTYFNTSTDSLQTWDGAQWVAAGGGSAGEPAAWDGTQAEYDGLGSWDADRTYYVVG